MRQRAYGLASWVAAAVCVGCLVALVVVLASPRRAATAEFPAGGPARASSVSLVKASSRVVAGHRARIEVVALGARVCGVRFRGPQGSHTTRKLKFFPRNPVIRISFKVAAGAQAGLWRLNVQCGSSRRHPASLGSVRVRLRIQNRSGAHGSLVVSGSATVQSSVVAAREAFPTAASSGSVPGASPPVWLPIRKAATVGCVLNNCRPPPYHNYWAIDLLNPNNLAGDPIYAAGGGRVHIISRSSVCGPIGSFTPANAVQVDHGHGLVTWYYHLKRIDVTEGQIVTPNTQLGTMDSTGQTSPCLTHHLHFEEVLHGTPVYFGPLKACHGSQLVTYPQLLGFTNWNRIPPFRYAVHSDGTVCSRTLGSSWRVVSGPTVLGYDTSASCADSQHCWLAGDDGMDNDTIAATTDAGQTWGQQRAPTGWDFLFGISCPTKLDCWIDGKRTSDSAVAVERTTDGGHNWVPVTIAANIEQQTTTNPYAFGISCPDATHCRFTSFDFALVTDDAGNSWTLVGAPSNGTFGDSLSCPDDLYCYTYGKAGNAEVVYGSTDGGHNWTQLATLPKAFYSPYGMSCSSASVCTLVGLGGSAADVVSTIDGWHSVHQESAPPGFTTLRSVSCTDSLHCWASGAVAGNLAIAATANGGHTWTSQSTPAHTGIPYLNSTACAGNGTAATCFALANGHWVYPPGKPPYYTHATVIGSTQADVSPHGSP